MGVKHSRGRCWSVCCWWTLWQTMPVGSRWSYAHIDGCLKYIHTQLHAQMQTIAWNVHACHPRKALNLTETAVANRILQLLPVGSFDMMAKEHCELIYVFIARVVFAFWCRLVLYRSRDKHTSQTYRRNEDALDLYTPDSRWRMLLPNTAYGGLRKHRAIGKPLSSSSISSAYT